LVTDIVSGNIDYSSAAHQVADATIEGLTAGRDGSLNVLVVGKESLEYSLVKFGGEPII
jgi:hypothetical protein